MNSLADIIGSLSNIIHLDLSDLTIEDKDIIKSLFETLTKLNKLREFYFEYNISDLEFQKGKDKE